ncbi:MAG: sulfatase-like hydrolase/transferase [Chitinophagales bacterium]|nr:sulfatase-like hydrolase/transferase [Chitinophagales bacterium]
MKHHVLLLLLISVFNFIVIQESFAACNPGIATNLKLSDKKSCSIKLSWSPSTGQVNYYKVKYRVTGTTGWNSAKKVDLDLSYTFTDLNPSTSYDFAVTAYCKDGTSGENAIKTGSTTSCTIPETTTLNVFNNHSAIISWSGCPSSFNQLRYRKASSSTWFYVSTGSLQTVTLTTLSTNTAYVYQLVACKDTADNWSKIDSFTTTVARPNILFIILDDSRYDSFSSNGGPSWFHTSNMDRISKEGANFKVSCVVFSFCVPSRASIVTGLYPHKNGAVSNTSDITPGLPTTATILDSAGYYTGWIGKYHIDVSPQPGYDYWLGTKVNSGTDEFNNLQYNYNGTLKTINGHDTKTVTDSSAVFVDRHYTQNFFLTVAYHGPHNPFIPQPQYSGIYADDPMPVPPNTAPYTVNYPSFLYKQLPPTWYIAPSDIPPLYEGYFEMLAGIDEGIGEILQKLTDYDILDNTLVIFTSDNGYIFGEHGLFNKRLAYDPSIRVPLFVRYPAWYSANTVINNQIALNVDFAPTILAAAGIKTPYNFDGASLKDLSDGLVNRQYIYYEYIYSSAVVKLPYIRAVRSLNDMYISYGCNSQTEEFFDLTIDPLENTNQINKSSYSSLINTFRNQLATFETTLHDNYLTPISTCSLLNPQKNEEVNYTDSDLDIDPSQLIVYPVPATKEIDYYFISRSDDANAKLVLTNLYGEVVQQQPLNVAHGENAGNLNLNPNLTSGLYYLTVNCASARLTSRIVINPE